MISGARIGSVASAAIVLTALVSLGAGCRSDVSFDLHDDAGAEPRRDAGPGPDPYPLLGIELGGLPLEEYAGAVDIACGPEVCLVLAGSGGVARFERSTGAPIDDAIQELAAGARQAIWADDRFYLIGLDVIYELGPEGLEPRVTRLDDVFPAVDDPLQCTVAITIDDGLLVARGHGESGVERTQLFLGASPAELVLVTELDGSSCRLAATASGAALAVSREGRSFVVPLAADGVAGTPIPLGLDVCISEDSPSCTREVDPWCGCGHVRMGAISSAGDGWLALYTGYDGEWATYAQRSDGAVSRLAHTYRSIRSAIWSEGIAAVRWAEDASAGAGPGGSIHLASFRFPPRASGADWRALTLAYDTTEVTPAMELHEPTRAWLTYPALDAPSWERRLVWREIVLGETLR